MSKTISRTLNITRVTFCTVEVTDGTPQFVPHSDAVFPGQLEKDKVKKLLQGRYGKDAILVITNIDAGQHRYSMNLEDFVLHATITDGAFDDEEDDPDPELPDDTSAPGGDDDKATPVPGAEAPASGDAPAPALGAADAAAASGGEAAGADVGEQPYDDELPDAPAW